jgi:hypothetical protein
MVAAWPELLPPSSVPIAVGLAATAAGVPTVPSDVTWWFDGQPEQVLWCVNLCGVLCGMVLLLF